MITMWILLGVAGTAMLAWRLRRANATLDRILREETREGVTRQEESPESEAEALPTPHHR